MIDNNLSIVASNSSHNSIFTPSTTISIEIHMANASNTFIIINTGIHRCRPVTITVVVTMTSIAMIAINTIMVIDTSTV